MKKVIVIISAVMAIFYSLGSIGFALEYNLPKFTQVGLIICGLITIMISSQVLYNDRHIWMQRIVLTVLSIFMTIVSVSSIGLGLYGFLSQITQIDIAFELFNLVANLAVLIICLTYIRRVLWPAQK